MIVNPIRRYRNRKAVLRLLANEAEQLRFQRYVNTVMSEMSKNGMMI